MMMNPMIMEQMNDGSGAGYSAPPAPPAQGAPPAPPNAPSGDQYDEFGYAIQSQPGQPPAPPAPPAQVPAQVIPPVVPPVAPPAPPAQAAPAPAPTSTGYGAPPAPPVAAAPPAAAPPVTPPAAPPAAPPAGEVVFTDDDFAGVGDNDKVVLKKLATDKKWSKEFLKDVVELRKLDYSEAAKVRNEQTQTRQQKLNETRTNNYNELMADPTFGGQNFNMTVHKVDKVLAEHLPSIKKNLTETGGMLPPNIMREIAKMAVALYGTESFEQGSGHVKEADPNDHLDFYTN